MTFDFACGGCGRALAADWRQAGQPMACPGCGATVLVPVPRGLAGPGADGPVALLPVTSLRFSCAGCGRRFSAKPAMAGKRIRCGGCGAKVDVPGPGGAVPGRPHGRLVPRGRRRRGGVAAGDGREGAGRLRLAAGIPLQSPGG